MGIVINHTSWLCTLESWNAEERSDIPISIANSHYVLVQFMATGITYALFIADQHRWHIVDLCSSRRKVNIVTNGQVCTLEAKGL